jgi:hypothetical protein
MGAVVGRYGHDGAAAPGEPVSVGQFVSLGLLTIKRQRQGNCNSGSLRDDNKKADPYGMTTKIQERLRLQLLGGWWGTRLCGWGKRSPYNSRFPLLALEEHTSWREFGEGSTKALIRRRLRRGRGWRTW